MKIRYLLLLILIVLGGSPAPETAAATELSEFSFSRPAAVLHGRAAIEDFALLMQKEANLSTVDFAAPYTAAVFATNCDSQKTAVVLIAFPNKRINGWAYSVWERNPDGLISRLVSVGFSSETLDSLLKQARGGGALCE